MQLMRGGSACETVVTSELAREHGHEDCLGHDGTVCLHAGVGRAQGIEYTSTPYALNPRPSISILDLGFRA